MKRALVRLKDAPYGGKAKAGDRYSLPTREADAHVLLGLAKYDDNPEAQLAAEKRPRKTDYKRRDLQPETQDAPAKTNVQTIADFKHRSPEDFGTTYRGADNA